MGHVDPGPSPRPSHVGSLFGTTTTGSSFGRASCPSRTEPEQRQSLKTCSADRLASSWKAPLPSLLIMAAAKITQHFKLMRGTVVPRQSVIAVVCLVKCKQFAEELCPFVLDRTLSNNNRNRPGSALLLGLLRGVICSIGGRTSAVPWSQYIPRKRWCPQI